MLFILFAVAQSNGVRLTTKEYVDDAINRSVGNHVTISKMFEVSNINIKKIDGQHLLSGSRCTEKHYFDYDEIIFDGLNKIENGYVVLRGQTRQRYSDLINETYFLRNVYYRFYLNITNDVVNWSTRVYYLEIDTNNVLRTEYLSDEEYLKKFPCYENDGHTETDYMIDFVVVDNKILAAEIRGPNSRLEDFVIEDAVINGKNDIINELVVVGGDNFVYSKSVIDNKLANIGEIVNASIDDKFVGYAKEEWVRKSISDNVTLINSKYDVLAKQQSEFGSKFDDYYNKSYVKLLENRISELEGDVTALKKYVEEMELSSKLKDAVSGIGDWYKDDGTSIVLNSEEGGVCKYTSAATLRPQDMTNDYECFSLITFTPGSGAEYESGYAGYYINTRTNKQIPVSGNMYNSQKYDYSINIENDKLMLLRLGKCNIEHIGHGFVYYIKNIT